MIRYAVTRISLIQHLKAVIVVAIIVICVSQVSANESKLQADVNQFIRKISTAKVWRDRPKLRIALQQPSASQEPPIRIREFLRLANAAIAADPRLELLDAPSSPDVTSPQQGPVKLPGVDVSIEYDPKIPLAVKAIDRRTLKVVVKVTIPALAWWQHALAFVKKNIVGAVLALIGVLIAGLVRRVWREITTLVWNSIRWLGALPGLRWLAIHAYFKSVRETYGEVTNIYLDRKETLDLHRVFVPLGLTSSDARLPSPYTRQSTREILTDPVYRRLVVLGAPGSGKTTLLKALASGVSRRQWVEYRDLIPIVVILRQYARQDPLPTLHDWLIQTLLPGHGLRRNTEAILRTSMHTGRILLLLDGLDEITSDKLPMVIERIIAFRDRLKVAI